MGKSKNDRRLPEDQAMAKASTIRSGERKLNVVAASIRGMDAAAALTRLAFEKRRVAQEVRKVLQSAIANAENNHSLDVDRLVVSEAYVGRAFVMKRFHARARGRGASIQKPFSNLTIIVRERKDGEVDAKRQARRARGLSKKTTIEPKKTTTKKAASSAAEA